MPSGKCSLTGLKPNAPGCVPKPQQIDRGIVMNTFALDPQKLVTGCAILMACLVILAAPRLSHAADVQPGNPDQGKILFEKRCTGCHSLDQDKEGPRLRGVVGRKAGKVGSFSYSDGLKDAQFNWD